MSPFERGLHRFGFATIALLCWGIVSAASAQESRTPAPTAPPTGESRLERGKEVERPLAVGEVHRYSMDLGAGESVSVLFRRHGMPLSAAVYGPDDAKLKDFSSSYAKEGEEKLDFVAQTPGRYRLEVRTLFKPKPPGRYAVVLLERRRAPAGGESPRPQPVAQSCRERNWLDSQDKLNVALILNSVADCMAVVADKVGDQKGDARQVAEFTRAQVGFLTSRWHWGEPISAAYQESLQGDFRTLALAAQEGDKNRAYSMMREVADDLKIKAKHCSKSTRGLGKDVTVNVTTKNGAREDPGWVVYYKLRIYQFTPDYPPLRFPKLSSPTQQDLPPGKYLMWVGSQRQPEPPQAQKQLIEVGEGKPRMEWDLFTP